MDYEFEGFIEKIYDTRTFGLKGFTIRNFVVAQNPMGERMIPAQFTLKGEKVKLLDALVEGDQVKVTFTLSGRKWQRSPQDEVKYFVDLVALNVVCVSHVTRQTPPVPPPPKAPSTLPSVEIREDDIPF